MDDEAPASASENCAHGALKIGPRRWSDFFNRIDPKLTFDDRSFDHLVGADDQRLRQSEAEHFGGVEIENSLNLVGCSTGSSRVLRLSVFCRRRLRAVDMIGEVRSYDNRGPYGHLIRIVSQCRQPVPYHRSTNTRPQTEK